MEWLIRLLGRGDLKTREDIKRLRLHRRRFAARRIKSFMTGRTLRRIRPEVICVMRPPGKVRMRSRLLRWISAALRAALFGGVAVLLYMLMRLWN